ncbi:MAG: protein phosphatase 2C domain-containing protein [Verrucomicrobiota bacterium]
MKANITQFGLARGKVTEDAWVAELWRDQLIGVVADGVGDARYPGEAASKATASILTHFKSRPSTWSVDRALEEFARLVNRQLHQESIARFERAEMLSTLAVAVVEGRTLHGLNVGDSRIYLHRRGRLTQLSEDHVETGDRAHVLSRAVGMAEDVRPHSFEMPVEDGDVVLLCSDGVSGVLGDAELCQLLDRRASARLIVLEAREKASEETLDDMSAVVMEIVQTDGHKVNARQLEIPDTLKAGQKLDGFTLVRPFSENERTWIARRGEETLVVKFAPREALGSERIRDQFMKEIWSLTRRQADYFTRAFVPEQQSALYYCMEYFEAPTLKEILQNGPLRVDETIALAQFLLSAAQFLLQLDLVHGDIKPENILVRRDGGRVEFRLIDFGSVGEIFSVTSRAGTPSYLAPERFNGVAISERTEIFALGVTLYYALTTAFPYGEIEPFQNPQFRAARPPSKFNPNLPPWLDTVLLRATAIRSEDRYQNYSEMKFDLENPGRVKPYIQNDAPWLERNPLLFYKVGFFMFLATTLILLVLLARR